MAKRPASSPNAKVGKEALERIPKGIQESMVEAIRNHAGSEVLFHAKTNAQGKVLSILDVAHGSRGMVPVLRHGLEAGDVLIHNHPSGSLVPSDADVNAAAHLGDQGVGAWIVDNEVTRLYIITEPWLEPPKEMLGFPELQAVFAHGGPLAQKLPHYKPRQGQIDMVQAVARGFNEDILITAEAGTGVGKSYAYLVPALLWASRNKDRVVVSTATINLQQQIIEKDIPTLLRVLGLDLKAVLAKGRGNYLCIKRFKETVDEEGLLVDENGDLRAISQWVETTKDGSRTDLVFIPPDHLWSRINADADACSGPRCPYRDDCFFFKARREAASAHIVVANHHLVFADAAMRSRGLGFESTVVLPSFRRLIFDEAHTIEQAATSFFSESLNRFTVLKYLGLLSRKKRQSSFGLLPALDAMGLLHVPHVEQLMSRVKDAMFRLDALGLVLLGSESSLRLDARSQGNLEAFLMAMSDLQAGFMDLGETLRDAMADIELEEPVPAVEELDLLVKRILALASLAGSFRLWHQSPGKVYWLERLKGPGGEAAVQCTISPLEIGGLLAEAIFKPYPTVIMTSATLRVQGTFDFFFLKLGIPLKGLGNQVPPPPRSEWDGFSDDTGRGYGSDSLEDVQELPESESSDLIHLPTLERQLFVMVAESPFDYANRVRLAIPLDAPDPSSSGYQQWLQDFVRDALLESGGHGLVLFTSYDMLQKTWAATEPALRAAGIGCFRQGDEERSKLLRRFNEAINSCLFATDSFWEGVDSPGETLQVVIVCKLPFKVPTEPLVVARKEAMEARGINHFMVVSVPEAVMKLRQGFGRLMRRESDWGVVLITDPRIVSKSYGRHFLKSLPEMRHLKGGSGEVLGAMGAFLRSMRNTLNQ